MLLYHNLSPSLLPLIALRLSSASHTEAQSGRGVRQVLQKYLWAAFDSHSLLPCGCSLLQVFNLDSLVHSRQQLNNPSFPPVIRPHHPLLATVVTSPSVVHSLKDQHRPLSPPTLDPVLRLTTGLSCRRIGCHTLNQRSAYGCWK